MAKYKKIVTKGFGAGKRKLATEIDKVNALMRKLKFSQALQTLNNLETEYPDEPEIYLLQGFIYRQVKDDLKYQYCCQRIVELQPNNAEALLAYSYSCLNNANTLTATNQFQKFQETWPNHKQIPEVNKILTVLKEEIPSILTQLNLTEPDSLEIATLHEKASFLSTIGKHQEGKLIFEQILEKVPNFAPALNNIVQTYWLDDNLKKALEAAKKALEINPDNDFAILNYNYYLLLSGDIESAKKQIDNFKEKATFDRVELWIKLAEFYSLLGEDEQVLNAYNQAQKAELLHESEPHYYIAFMHLVGCAQLRQGNSELARETWKKVLKISPNYAITRKNLEDLNQPISERHSPWPFPMSQWLTKSAVIDLSIAVVELNLQDNEDEDEEKNQQALKEIAQNYLINQHPEVKKLIPLLLDRGDPESREFALNLIKISQLPELLEVLKPFAFGQRGPDESRYEAAVFLKKAKLLNDNSATLWLKGKWTEIMIFGFEISSEPTYNYEPKIYKLVQKAQQNLKQNKGKIAEDYLRNALKITPKDPSLLNNLAVALSQQGRDEEALELIYQIHEDNPEYIFAALKVASIKIASGEIEAAEKIITSFLNRDNFHASEFAVFCDAQIELLVAKKQTDGIESWLKMWEQVYPDHPGLSHWQKRFPNR